MAKRNKPPMDYGAEVKRLRAEGPQRVYILRGDEDYLRESYLAELRALCVPEGTEAFNYHRLQGPGLDVGRLRESAEAMPFMGERTFTEVRDFDPSKTSGYDPEGLKSLLKDVPEWATVAFVYSQGMNPDGKFGAVQTMRKVGLDLEFTSPGESALVKWIAGRAKRLDKTVDPATAQYLMATCGKGMNTLSQELAKLAHYAKGTAITRADIDAVVTRAPDATIRRMLIALGEGKYDDAAELMADLLADKNEPPQKQIASVSGQFRQMYVTKVAMESGRGDSYITACIPELTGWYGDIARLKRTVSRYSLDRLARAVSLCAACDYAMKDTGGDAETLMKELILRLAMDKV